MKKLSILIAVVLVAVVFLALVYLKRPVTLGDSVAASLVPGDAVALFQVTDLPRSRERWRETDLYKIAHEPEVQAFLEKPKSAIPNSQQAQDKWNLVKKMDAKEGFLAVTVLTDKVPKFIAGFDYKGKRADVESLVSDLKGRLKDAYPAGKSDIVQYGPVEIETFAFEGTMAASVFKDHWFLVSDDLDLLKATLDRLDGKAGATPSLRDNAAYKSALAKLPQASDLLLFVQPQTILERLTSLVSISNPNVDMKPLDDLKKVQAISAGTKFDGGKIRDAIYVLKPGGGSHPPMARNSLAFTSPDTFFYFAKILVMDGAPKLPDPSLDSTGILAALDRLRQIFNAAGLTYEDFKSAFGPEFGTALDWPPVALQPALLFSLDVRDTAKAGKFVDTLTNGHAGLPPWGKQEIDGVPYYSRPAASAGLLTVTPVIALTDKELLFSLNPGAVQQAVQNAKSGSPGLEKNPGFQAATGQLAKPSGAFGYIDSKGLFEKVYGILRSTLPMMALFNPHASDYADLGKLPPTEAISKHLSPIVYSQSSDQDGTLMESVGPVTFNQAIFGLAAGAGAAVVPTLQKQLHARPVNPILTPSSSAPVPAQVASPTP